MNEIESPHIRLTVALAMALLSVTCGQSKAPSDADRLAALQLSQTCADAGAKYSDWWAHTAIGWTVTETSAHYNRAMSRCIVSVTAFASGGMERTALNDAIERVPFASYMTMTKSSDTTVEECYTTDAKGKRVDCVDDKRLVNVARSVYDEYRDLVMKQ